MPPHDVQGCGVTRCSEDSAYPLLSVDGPAVEVPAPWSALPWTSVPRSSNVSPMSSNASCVYSMTGPAGGYTRGDFGVRGGRGTQL